MFRTCGALLLASVAIAGCGDEQETSSTGGSAAGKPGDTRLTKQEYVARADAICVETEDAQRKIQDQIAEIDRGNIERGLASYFRDQVKETREGFARLKKLSPPRADQAQVDEYLDAVEQLLDSRDALARALRKDDRAGISKALREARRIDGEQEILADLLGLVDCRNIV